MEPSLEIMETSETESLTRSDVESSLQAESIGKESPFATQAKPSQASQEKRSHSASPFVGGVSSQEKPPRAALSPLPGTSAGASPSAASGLEKGPAQKKPCIDSWELSSAAYLDSTVVPILHLALVSLERLRPEDPLQYIIDFLLKNKAQFSKKIPCGENSPPHA